MEKYYYTGVGSRDTPENITDIMSDIAVYLSKFGHILRSGRAEGADWAFQRGAEFHAKNIDIPQTPKTEIYVPNKRFNLSFGRLNEIDPKDLDNYADAEDICSTLHPVFDKLIGFARDAHVRNVYQVLGQDLNTPSSFLLCWAPIKNGRVTGGTATAVALANKLDIEVYNFYIPRHLEAFLEEFPIYDY